MSEIVTTAYFVIGGFAAGPVVWSIYKEIEEDGFKEMAEAKIMLLILGSAIAWVCWPLAWGVRRAMLASPIPTPNKEASEG